MAPVTKRPSIHTWRATLPVSLTDEFWVYVDLAKARLAWVDQMIPGLFGIFVEKHREYKEEYGIPEFGSVFDN